MHSLAAKPDPLCPPTPYIQSWLRQRHCVNFSTFSMAGIFTNTIADFELVDGAAAVETDNASTLRRFGKFIFRCSVIVQAANAVVNRNG